MSDSETDSLLKEIGKSQAQIDAEREAGREKEEWARLTAKLRREAARSPSPSSSETSSRSRSRERGISFTNTSPDILSRIYDDVDRQLDDIDNANTKVSIRYEQLHTDLQLSEKDLFQHCNNMVNSILRQNSDTNFYIGVAENPLRRWSEENGHHLRFHTMYLLGFANNGSVLARVETRLIEQPRNLLANCVNIGPGGEHVARKSTTTKFLYVCISWLATNRKRGIELLVPSEPSEPLLNSEQLLKQLDIIVLCPLLRWQN